LTSILESERDLYSLNAQDSSNDSNKKSKKLKTANSNVNGGATG